MHYKVEIVGEHTESFDNYYKAYQRCVELVGRGSRIRLWRVAESLLIDASKACENCGAISDVLHGLCDICCDRAQDDAGC